MRIWTTVIGQRLDGAESTRSMRIASELAGRGHDVTLWTSAFDHIRKEWRSEWKAAGADGSFLGSAGFRIRFMKGCGYHRNVSPRRLLDHSLAARDFLSQARRLGAPDLILASLPDHRTCHAAVEFGRANGCPVVVDVRDQWPDILLERIGGGWARSLAELALILERRVARRALGRATDVVAMMDSMMDWGLRTGGRPRNGSERVFPLTTAERNFGSDREDPEPGTRVAEIVEAVRGRVVFAFTGTFNQTQHPDLILDAVELMARRGDWDPERAALVIGGTGEGADRVAARAKRLKGVHIAGWLNTREMRALLAGASVGMLPLRYATPAFNNKAFSYLASGLPIVNAATGDLWQLIDRERLGINFLAGDTEALADAMARLLRDDVALGEMRANVRVIFDQQFEPAVNYRAFADHLEAIAKRHQLPLV